MELSYEQDSEWLQQYSLENPNVYPESFRDKTHKLFSQQFPNITDVDLRRQTSFDGHQSGVMYYRNNITQKIYKFTNKDYQWHELEDEEAKILLKTHRMFFECITYIEEAAQKAEAVKLYQ